MNLSGKIVTTITSKLAMTTDVGTMPWDVAKSITQTITNGTGAGNAQVAWADTRDLNATTAETIDIRALVGGGLPGTTLISKLKGIVIQLNTTTSGAKIEVGGGATTPFTAIFKDASDIISVGAGGSFTLTNFVDGYTVGTSTKLLQINNPGGAAVNYTIYLVGEGSIS